MNKKISIPKLFIAVFLLTAYCNVLITQFHCNFPHLLEAAEQHDHHHDNDTTPLAEHSHSDSDEHNDSKNDNCCNDKTSAFFASQTNPVNPTFEFKNIFFTEFVSFSNTIVNTPLPFNSKEYFSYKSPPPKIPDIRIFTHSFII